MAANRTFRHSTVLISLLLLIFLPAIGENSIFSAIVRGVLLLSLLSASVYAFAPKHPVFGFLLPVGSIGFLAHVLFFFYPHSWIFLTSNIFLSIFFIATTLVIMSAVFRSEVVTSDTIIGSINIYLLLGLTFSLFYAFVEFAYPGSFTVAADQKPLALISDESIGDTFSAFLYFSFVTLATLGYGDIVPTLSLARSLSVLQAMMGQFYLAILVARLVASHVERKKSSEHTL